MNTFMHNAVTAALPSKPKVRQLGTLVFDWYRPRHALIWKEVRKAVLSEDAPAPAAADETKPVRKLRFN